jgi:hypothetical protein
VIDLAEPAPYRPGVPLRCAVTQSEARLWRCEIARTRFFLDSRGSVPGMVMSIR